MFRYLVLGLLRSGQAYHGYALMKAYRDRSGVSISTGNFYRELQRLVGEGLVQTVENPPGADARRSPYTITEQGVASFEAWLLSAPTDIGSYDDELSSRAVFVGETGRDVAKSLLEHWRESIWIYGKQLEREREVVLAPTPELTFSARGILLARRLKHVAADLEFIEELRNALVPKAIEEAAPQPVPEPKPARKPAAKPAARRKSRQVATKIAARRTVVTRRRAKTAVAAAAKKTRKKR